MKSVTTPQNEDEMMALGGELAKHCIQQRSCIVFLQGELGAGKTTLVRGFLRALGHPGRVKSPTFTLVEHYHLHERDIYHFDFYRLIDPEELELIGIRDYLSGDAICLIEWPERAASLLPAPDITCKIDIVDDYRRVTLLGL